MNVNNDSWQLVGDATPTTLIVQNVGVSSVMYVFKATQPAAGDFLAKGEHFVLYGHGNERSYGNLNVEGKSMYARAAGSKAGFLSVESYAP